MVKVLPDPLWWCVGKRVDWDVMGLGCGGIGVMVNDVSNDEDDDTGDYKY